MKIAFLGYGQVGGALADHLQRRGHEVFLAASDPNSASVQKAIQRNGQLLVSRPKEAVESADVVFLATPFQAVEAALTPLKDTLKGKVLVDCTNPVGPNSRMVCKASSLDRKWYRALFPVLGWSKHLPSMVLRTSRTIGFLPTT